MVLFHFSRATYLSKRAPMVATCKTKSRSEAEKTADARSCCSQSHASGWPMDGQRAYRHPLQTGIGGGGISTPGISFRVPIFPFLGFPFCGWKTEYMSSWDPPPLLKVGGMRARRSRRHLRSEGQKLGLDVDYMAEPAAHGTPS